MIITPHPSGSQGIQYSLDTKMKNKNLIYTQYFICMYVFLSYS